MPKLLPAPVDAQGQIDRGKWIAWRLPTTILLAPDFKPR